MDIISLLTRLAAMAVFYFAPDIFLHGAVRAAFPKTPTAVRKFWIVNIAFFLITASGFLLMQFMGDVVARINLYFFGVFVSILFAKLIAALVLLLVEDIWRIPVSLFTYKKRKAAAASNKTGVLIDRRTFIARTAVISAALPFTGFMYGMLRGRYRFTIHRETIHYADLPDAFDGITITQISDLHMGSWDSAAKAHLEELMEMIRGLRSDIIFFTGDIVNSKADEMNGWYDTVNSMEAPLGKFSILGNHDYGDYVNWITPEDKAANLDLVKNIHPAIGFNLLLNTHTSIERSGQQLYIAGVENWGKGDFPKFGDIDRAMKGIPADAFVILLSHDPSHWREKVLHHNKIPQLTLSGHTHGFQMGIETPAIRISPSQLVYKEWAGLYHENNVHLYVNRGLGTVGYPGRLGIWPEITQITLRKKA